MIVKVDFYCGFCEEPHLNYKVRVDRDGREYVMCGFRSLKVYLKRTGSERVEHGTILKRYNVSEHEDYQKKKE